LCNICNKLASYGEEILSPHLTTRYRLSATAYSHVQYTYRGRLLRNPRTHLPRHNNIFVVPLNITITAHTCLNAAIEKPAVTKRITHVGD